MLAKEWLNNAQSIMNKIDETQIESIKKAALVMADSIEKERWVHTFGCGHATLPIQDMYPRIGGFVGFHHMLELPLTFFTNIDRGMSVQNFVFLERVEGYGKEIMKGYNFHEDDCFWLFSHTGINAVNIDIALKVKEMGNKLIVFGSAAEAEGKQTRHSSGKTLFELADVVVDTCVPIQDASVDLKNHFDKVGPVSTIGFVTAVWMTVLSVAEILADRGVKLHIHPSHNVPGDTTAHERLEEALAAYKERVVGI
ncbi:sugar isomerase domain-containing protein [Mariniphaga sediminis]|uniref:Sugar isomerase domain-containing protein n=1 Tax=Mariniphaga sediminis TaxID=1628158 RepID=A0A399CYV2_9BACT|nr:sugar isomerase domain-containing protein [Mariniphaga sediminis]RIH64935.1 sugar isomerase domain-containing protein [Mariniphaga sediminis]